ncbi:exported hypothetical protein [Vibrio chagasii]|nr:exported hypothetical protein [Vibrio chagasii]
MKSNIGKLVRSLVLCSALLGFHVSADDGTQTHYERLPKSEFVFNESDSKHHKEDLAIEVVYFFNNNCPACTHFTPIISDWFKEMPVENVNLIMAPYPTHPDWIWSTILYFAAEDINPDYDIFDIHQVLIENDAIISQRDEVIAFLMNRVGADYLTAEEYASVERYEDKIATIVELFDSYEAKGTPNVGITASNGERFLVGPQHNKTFTEMITAINGISAYILEYTHNM